MRSKISCDQKRNQKSTKTQTYKNPKPPKPKTKDQHRTSQEVLWISWKHFVHAWHNFNVNRRLSVDDFYVSDCWLAGVLGKASRAVSEERHWRQTETKAKNSKKATKCRDTLSWRIRCEKRQRKLAFRSRSLSQSHSRCRPSQTFSNFAQVETPCVHFFARVETPCVQKLHRSSCATDK